MKTCSRCLRTATLYQNKTCKACLTKDFASLRPLIDMTRQITISRNTNHNEVENTIVPLPFREGATSKYPAIYKNCGVRSHQGQDQ